MINHGMEYNSQQEDLRISEYGRHVQNLIQYCQKVDDKEKRQAIAEDIVELMQQMNPSGHRYEGDQREKLWRHLFRIADYNLDVVPPSGVVPSPEMSEYVPSPVPYPASPRGYRHYGSHVRKLIDKAIKMEDDKMRDEFTQIIAAYMKTAYRTWNREHFVSDEIIKSDLKKLSDGKLELDSNHVIDAGGGNHSSGHKGKRGRSTGSNRNKRNSRSSKGSYKRRK